MNEISPIISRAQAVRQTERRALLRLAIKQRRLSWQYRRWAAEDEAAGKQDDYRKHLAEAERLIRDARWHIQFARNRTDD